MTRDEAIEELKELMEDCEKCRKDAEKCKKDKTYYVCGRKNVAIRKAIEALSEPQIILCKDCRYCTLDNDYHDYWCNAWTGSIKVWAEHYCGCGKEKEA